MVCLERQAVVTDKWIREKALAIATELNETEFKASHWQPVVTDK